MKSLKEIAQINAILKKNQEEIERSLKNLKNQYKRNIKAEKEKILKQISSDYNLNFDELVSKYIKKEAIHEKILEIIEIEGVEYFYENIDNGKIFNKDNDRVGTLKNKKFILDSK